jgi:tetratricopeptide (TPR) repeat protein
VAIGAVDLLLGHQGPDGRRLLWVLALAGEPVEEGMLGEVWGAVAGGTPALLSLHQSGLVHRESDPGPWTCHELVRERVLDWMQTHPDERAGRTADEVRVAYAERFEALFRQLLGSGAENAREAAVIAGRRALGYCVRAGALGRLGGFVSKLVTSTREPRLLDSVVRELQSVVELVPEGEPRWSLRTYIADGLSQAGRPDEALPFFEQAAAEAESAAQWVDFGWISENRASALADAGQLEAAKGRRRIVAEFKRKFDRAAVEVNANELEALGIVVIQGQAELARPEIELRLGQVRGWWRRTRAGETVAEAPDPELLGRAMVGALDVARRAVLAPEEWEASLALLDELESVQRDLGSGEHERARTRFHRYGPLLRLRRLPEAQSVLEECLAVFRRYDDLTAQVTTLNGLADLWNRKDDPRQAADLERRALDLSNRLPGPECRGASHENLAIYLRRLGATADSAPHHLAALCYALIGGYGDLRNQIARNLSIAMAESRRQGETYPLPRLTTLLADPRFAPLRRFIAAGPLPPADLQQAIDALLAGLDGP